ncbi:STAS domain-containing protein [Kouleothrix sp.]|uniref:STAS domain-containing protein n=1 Tax=Kouleothrix sp. TaxID=2779161 RepID=UPI00391CB81D
MKQPASPPASPSTLSGTRTQRMMTFVITLVLLNMPIFVIGLLDARSSPVTLILSSAMFLYYGVYYLLVRAGYGEPGTYACVLLLAVVLGAGSHNGGGFMMATNALYLLLLVAVGLVLDSERALDVTLLLCMLSYGALVYVELAVAPPLVFATLYTTHNRLAVSSVVLALLITMAGVWRLMRANLVMMRRITGELEQASAAADRRASENGELVVQAQASNTMLRATEARLRETVDALALPLIPLDEGVALLPLVGYIDERRAERLMEGLLEGIHTQRVRGVVIDITGLRDVDARVAGTLLRATIAARLLGTRVVLSGISAEAAQALVHLDTDMRAIETAGSLSQALRQLAA